MGSQKVLSDHGDDIGPPLDSAEFRMTCSRHSDGHGGIIIRWRLVDLQDDKQYGRIMSIDAHTCRRFPEHPIRSLHPREYILKYAARELMQGTTREVMSAVRQASAPSGPEATAPAQGQ